MHNCVLTVRKDDIESKYYADGEDAFAMSKDLTPLAERLAEEHTTIYSTMKRLPGSHFKPSSETSPDSTTNTSS